MQLAVDFQAMLERWEHGTATLPTEMGALSFSPLRISGDEVGRSGASVMESRPVRSEDEVVLPA